ncbi:MAG: GtrA family protein [Halobacteriaceae archaeon]
MSGGTLEVSGRLERFLRFGAVGTSAFVVNLVAFAALAPVIWSIAAATVSWFVATFSSYNLNRLFTFTECDTDYVRGWLRHLSVYTVGFVVYVVALVTVGLVTGQYVALTVAVGLGGVANFVGSEFWVFDVGT